MGTCCVSYGLNHLNVFYVPCGEPETGAGIGLVTSGGAQLGSLK